MLIKHSLRDFLRKLKLLPSLLSILFMFSACSNVPQNESVEKPEPVKAQKTEPLPAPLPDHPLSADVLYDYTVAELAAQRGEHQLAFEKYFALAQETRDPRIVKSAVRNALISKNENNISQSVALWGELEPDNIDVQQVLAVALLGVEQDQLAIDSLLKMLRLSANRADGMRRVNMILSQLKKPQRLYQIIDAINREFPKDYYSALYEAKFGLKFKDYEKAEKNIQYALDKKPFDFTGTMLKVNLLKRTERFEETKQLFLQTLPEMEEPTLLRLEFAKFLIEIKQVKPAIEQLEIIAEQNDEKGDILYAIGLLAMEVEAFDKAEYFYLKLYELENRNNQGAYLMGKLEVARKDDLAALGWFAKVDGGKYMYESVLHRAIILSDQKQYDDALALLEKHPAEAGKKMLNQLRLKAEILNQAKKYSASYEVYSTILEDEPEQPEVLYGRAMVAEKLGRIDLMEQDLLKIIEKNPEDSHALNALGYTLTENTERYQEAQQYIERALKIEPNDMATIDSMGWVLYKQGRLEEALSYLKRAYDMQHDPEIAAHYGEILWTMEKQEQAKKVWQRALESFPEHPVLKTTTEKFLK